MKKQHLASLSILSLDRKNNASKINKVLSKHSFIITTRLGVNVQRNCTDKCQTLITLIILATKEEIKYLEKDLREIANIRVKKSLF